MKLLGLPLIAITVISLVGLPSTYVSYTVWGSSGNQDFLFGVSYGGNTTAGAKVLIDKVKNYTNFFLINNWDINTNETLLNEICDLAAQSGLRFIVFFDFVSLEYYAWHQTWMDGVKQRYGDKFLGILLYDEPGGKQIETGQWDGGPVVRGRFQNVSSPSEAASTFVSLGRTQSMNDLRRRGIPVFTADFALYWYDYQAGYNSVFVELGWNNSRTQQIALCRGAANAFGRDWGAIVTWTYMQPPYIASGPEILQDMRTAYDAGAKYIIVFDWPTYPENNPYGILTEEHFTAMQQFWNYAQSTPKGLPKVTAQAALVLPKNYGGGLRRADDHVWAPLNVSEETAERLGGGPFNVTWRQNWPPETQSPKIWENLNKLSALYGLKLDIVFDNGDRLSFAKRYSRIYLWNDTIT
jgi:hypothetical protein